MNELMFNYMLQNLSLFLVWGGTTTLASALIFGLLQQSRHRAMITAQAQAELARTHLLAMQTQLQPHFLFNALNTISVLTTQDPERANTMILRLSDLLRQVLEMSRTEEVTLNREIGFLQGYIDIQRMRYCADLDVSFDVDPALLPARVPCFILQPLVENAIRHGLTGNAAGVRIEVRGFRRGGDVVLRVCDNGPGPANKARRSENGCGIGLTNTMMRLTCMYGQRASLALERREPQGTCVTVVLPYHDSELRS